MKNIGLVIKVFLAFYAIFFPMSIGILELLLRLLTPFSIFDLDSKSEFLLRLALLDVPPVVIVTAAFCKTRTNRKR